MDLEEAKKQVYGNFNKIPYNPDKCVKRIFGDWSNRQCSRKNGHGEHGLYCKQHDPVNVKKRDDAQRAKWEAERKANHETFRFNKASRTFYEVLKQIADGHNDARGLAQKTIEEFDKSD